MKRAPVAQDGVIHPAGLYLADIRPVSDADLGLKRDVPVGVGLCPICGFRDDDRRWARSDGELGVTPAADSDDHSQDQSPGKTKS